MILLNVILHLTEFMEMTLYVNGLEKKMKIKMGEVISMRDRLEKWKSAYRSHDDNGWLEISCSSNGRLCIRVGDEIKELDVVESVRLLGDVSKGMETAINSLYIDDYELLK